LFVANLNCRQPKIGPQQSGAFYITRVKDNLRARLVYSASTDRRTGVITGQHIALEGFYTIHDYPEHIRRIRFADPTTGQTLIFLTTNTGLLATTIAALYKNRWQLSTSSNRSSSNCAYSTFGHKRKRCEDPDLVCCLHLRADCNDQEGASTQCLALYLSTDSLSVHIRENRALMRLAAEWLHNENPR